MKNWPRIISRTWPLTPHQQRMLGIPARDVFWF